MSYTPKQIADMLGRTPKTVYRWIASGKLSATEFNGYYIINDEDLTRFKEANTKKVIPKIMQKGE